MAEVGVVTVELEWNLDDEVVGVVGIVEIGKAFVCVLQGSCIVYPRPV